jgi:hypothetical protein
MVALDLSHQSQDPPSNTLEAVGAVQVLPLYLALRLWVAVQAQETVVITLLLLRVLLLVVMV